MTKEQAAEALGISPRSVIRYAQRGLLKVRYAANETGGKIAIYDPSGVEALKIELDAQRLKPRTPPPPVRQADSGESVALVRGGKVAGELVEILSKLTETRAAEVRLSEKLTVSLVEAVKLSGLSEDFLRDALKSGSLRGMKGHRAKGWSIKASDLRAFVEGL